MFRPLKDQRVYMGDDGVNLHFLLEPAEMYNACRMFALITVAPGSQMKFHRHEAEMEAFYVMKGCCRFDDNGVMVQAGEGDLLCTHHDEGHCVYNHSTEPLELMALIVNRQQGVLGKG